MYSYAKETWHTENRKHVNCAVPCSESVEMVEPMLSVRIRSKPCTESCSRRRLRKRCSLCSCSLTLTAFLSCSSSFCKAHVSTDQNTKKPSCMICINLTMQTARNQSNQWKQYKNCTKIDKSQIYALLQETRQVDILFQTWKQKWVKQSHIVFTLGFFHGL